jgi:glutathione-regulated potassium-efflux system ancillary protein KefC
MAEHGLLLDVLIYLAASVVCVPITHRLRLGSVLGYLIAGCLIGPFSLGLVADVHSTMHFAEFGVVLMLFLIGLELDPQRLWTMRAAVFGGGALQMVACGAALALGLLACGLSLAGALIAGLSLALSSTAIAIQTMNERSLLNGQLGRSAFAVLLFQDIAAIPLIAAVPLVAAQGKSGGNGLTSLLSVLGALVAVVVLGRYLTNPILRVMAKTGLRELFTGFALLLVVGISALMQMAGISMALGAFLGGVLLASSEYRHALQSDIEPFKGLLMGLFFIAVGMSIDFALLRESPLLVLLLVVGLVALKTLVMGALGPRLNVPKKQRWLFAILLSQGGEFAFVVFGVASQAKLLPGRWDGLLTVAVALSMAFTPLMLAVYDSLGREDKVERKADEIESEHAPVIIAGFGRFGQIIGRLLFASGVRATVLDHDPDQIELLKKFGFRVFFGDVTRMELLHAAGIEQAKLLVVAIDDEAASLRLVTEVKEHFPRLRILARARNVGHYLALRRLGIEAPERETFESALHAGRTALEALGTRPYEAKELADRFRDNNVRTLERLAPLMSNEAERLSVARAARTQLEEQFAADRAERERVRGGWAKEDEAEREPATTSEPAS